MMLSLPLLVTLLSVASKGLAGPTTSAKCYCTPSQSCWPSFSALTTFAKTLSSPRALIQVHPSAYACHDPHYDATACSIAKASQTDSVWIANQPGSMDTMTFETSIFGNITTMACDFNTARTTPCGQGSVPTVGVNATTENDIVQALKFANTHNLRVVVKNSGYVMSDHLKGLLNLFYNYNRHDFFGRSTAPDSFLIWTHSLQSIAFLDSFTPCSCSTSKTSYKSVLTVGSGVSWNQAYARVFTQNRVIVGGISANGSVGAAGGWISGAGHSIISPTYGLGVDNVLQFRIVLSTGRIVDVSECSEPDLWWALRGGGGGTFGVITQVWYKTYPDTPGLLGFFAASAANGDAYIKLLQTFLKEHPALADNKWGGYNTLINESSVYSISAFYYRAAVSITDGPGLSQNMSTFFQMMTNISGVTVQNSLVTPLSGFQQLYGILEGAPATPAASAVLAMRALQASQIRKRSLTKRDSFVPSTNTPGYTEDTSRIHPRSIHSGTKLVAYTKFLAQQAYVIGK